MRERERKRLLSAKREEASVINQFAQITGNRYMQNRIHNVNEQPFHACLKRYFLKKFCLSGSQQNGNWSK